MGGRYGSEEEFTKEVVGVRFSSLFFKKFYYWTGKKNEVGVRFSSLFFLKILLWTGKKNEEEKRRLRSIKVNKQRLIQAESPAKMGGWMCFCQKVHQEMWDHQKHKNVAHRQKNI